MPRALQNPRVAAVVMAVLIVLSLFLGGGRSLRSLRGDVEEIFWNGEDGDGICVASDLSKNRDDARNLLTVAREYDLPGDVLGALEDAVAAADAAGRDMAALHAAGTEISRAVTDVYEALGRLSLSERDESYRQDLYHSVMARCDTMRRDAYNVQAQAFNEVLDGFPAGLLASIASVAPAPLFR